MQYLHFINIWAVIVSAVVAFVVGAVWYSPLLFAKQWMEAHGHTPEKLAVLQKQARRDYAVSFVCFLVMAGAMSLLVAITHMSAVSAGIKLGVLCWLGFAATIGLTANLYSNLPLKAFAIDAGYQLVYFILMGAILAGWH